MPPRIAEGTPCKHCGTPKIRNKSGAISCKPCSNASAKRWYDAGGRKKYSGPSTHPWREPRLSPTDPIPMTSLEHFTQAQIIRSGFRLDGCLRCQKVRLRPDHMDFCYSCTGRKPPTDRTIRRVYEQARNTHSRLEAERRLLQTNSGGTVEISQ